MGAVETPPPPSVTGTNAVAVVNWPRLNCITGSSPHNRENAQKGETKKRTNRAQVHCDVFIWQAIRPKLEQL